MKFKKFSKEKIKSSETASLIGFQNFKNFIELEVANLKHFV